ncbi:MAG TPA: flagellar motor protein MotB [Phycisphaerales bacterium]|nr:flagellar motor protein MotB [Phycisphaerales bacterium]HRQ74455.1 flagellar motor protein MotB [Phycisphaerales bacterium]
MKKRPKKASGGVPEWVVTFGDMMALLLVFFILIQMFSELKKEHEYQRVITAVKEAFGYAGGIGVLPIDNPPLRSIIEQLEQLALKNQETTKISQNDTPGVDGAEMRVTKVREGIVFTIGGPAMFDEGSAEIKPIARREIEKLATLLAGRKNKVIVRGHSAAKYLPANSPWADLDALSFARAKNVKDLLMELGIEDVVFRLEAVGIREPARPRAVDPADVAENRRVEVILTEQLVEEMNSDWLGTNPNLARGG